MLDDRLVYAKTARGVAEISERSGAVPLAVRRVLIMIDGRRSIAELAPLAPPGEIGTIVEQLEAQGLVYPAHADAAGARAEHADALVEDRPAATFEALKRRAVRELSDLLGPDAEVIAVRIEQTRTQEDLRHRLLEAERLVAGLLGEAQAQDFLRALRRR